MPAIRRSKLPDDLAALLSIVLTVEAAHPKPLGGLPEAAGHSLCSIAEQ
jgi:hypothetical protein